MNERNVLDNKLLLFIIMTYVNLNYSNLFLVDFLPQLTQVDKIN